MIEHVFVSGLGHSGSTVFQFMLSGDTRIQCVGEIGNMVADKRRTDWQRAKTNQCSCGALGQDCTFWSQFFVDQEKSDSDHYRTVLSASEDAGFQVLVDSSKRPRYYDMAESQPKVIYLVRDFRSWALSAIKLKKRKQETQGQKRKRFGYLYECYRYCYENWRDLRAFKQRNADILLVSYERMVFDQQKQMEKIYAFMGVVLPDDAHKNAANQVHVLFGNRMRADTAKRDTLIYSYEWMFVSRLILLAPFLWPVYLYKMCLDRRVAADFKP